MLTQAFLSLCPLSLYVTSNIRRVKSTHRVHEREFFSTHLCENSLCNDRSCTNRARGSARITAKRVHAKIAKAPRYASTTASRLRAKSVAARRYACTSVSRAGVRNVGEQAFAPTTSKGLSSPNTTHITQHTHMTDRKVCHHPTQHTYI
jgi:hypothetical protein